MIAPSTPVDLVIRCENSSRMLTTCIALALRDTQQQQAITQQTDATKKYLGRTCFRNRHEQLVQTQPQLWRVLRWSSSFHGADLHWVHFMFSGSSDLGSVVAKEPISGSTVTAFEVG